MILDNLSIAGLFIASLYLLLPILFGQELWRVGEDPTQVPGKTDGAGAWGCAREAAPCAEG
jgi:hypothetical protein